MKKTIKPIFIIISFSFIIYACTQNLTERNNAQILGEWYPLDDGNLVGYHFMENNLCENKLGYYNYFDSVFVPMKIEHGYYSNPYEPDREEWEISSHWQNIIDYKGNITFYDIEKDSLRILDLSKKALVKQKIKFLSSDTLLLSRDNNAIQEKYIRKNYHLDNEPLLDEIIFFLPAIHKYAVRERYLSIHRTGDVVVYAGSCHADFHKYKTHKEAFSEIENKFKKAKLKTIMDNQREHRDIAPTLIDSDTPSITFVKDNIMTTIENPVERINTKEFLWAYFSALFCTSQIYLEPCKLEDYMNFIVFPEIEFPILKFKTHHTVLDLSGSECFYLRNLISLGKETRQSFTPIYVLSESAFSKKQIKTDGRYYQCMKEGKNITVDIGFNFIEENDLKKYFRGKRQFVSVYY